MLNIKKRRLFVFVGVAALALSCGGKSPEVESPSPQPSAKTSVPDSKIFAPLPRATTAAELPVLMGQGGEDFTPCLRTKDNLKTEYAGAQLAGVIEDNKGLISGAIRAWFVEALAPAGLTKEQASGWEIQVEEPVVAEIDVDDIRFADEQKCVGTDTGFFPDNLKVATSLIGAQKFHFKTKLPVSFDLQEEMKKAVASEKMVMESTAFFRYEAAVDNAGKPIANQKGEALFKAPGGRLVTEKDVPLPEQRTMLEWTLVAKKPLYFAYREISEEAWRREGAKDVCDVPLVWNDITPRKPECDEFHESAFVATKTKEGEVAVTVTTDGKNRGVTIPLDSTKMIQVNDRILLWLSPMAIEEGVLLRLNSFVLNPQTAVLTQQEDAAVGEDLPLRKTETVSDEKPTPSSATPSSATPSPASKSKKPGKKKKTKSDIESIDEYLRN